MDDLDPTSNVTREQLEDDAKLYNAVEVIDRNFGKTFRDDILSRRIKMRREDIMFLAEIGDYLSDDMILFLAGILYKGRRLTGDNPRISKSWKKRMMDERKKKK